MFFNKHVRLAGKRVGSFCIGFVIRSEETLNVIKLDNGSTVYTPGSGIILWLRLVCHLVEWDLGKVMTLIPETSGFR